MTSSKPADAEVLDAEAVPLDQPVSGPRDQAGIADLFHARHLELVRLATLLVGDRATIPCIGGALIDPDGTGLTALVGLSDTSLKVVTIDVGTGKTQSVLYQVPANDTIANQLTEFHLGLDSTGRHVLVAGNQVHGWLSGGHLESLRPKAWSGAPISW